MEDKGNQQFFKISSFMFNVRIKFIHVLNESSFNQLEITTRTCDAFLYTKYTSKTFTLTAMISVLQIFEQWTDAETI